MRDVLERLRSSRVDVVFHEEGAEHLTHESRVRDHLSLIARKEGIAVFHAETRVFMGVIDTFTLLAYLLGLFGDATEQRTVVEERPGEKREERKEKLREEEWRASLNVRERIMNLEHAQELLEVI